MSETDTSARHNETDQAAIQFALVDADTEFVSPPADAAVVEPKARDAEMRQIFVTYDRLNTIVQQELTKLNDLNAIASLLDQASPPNTPGTDQKTK